MAARKIYKKVKWAGGALDREIKRLAKRGSLKIRRLQARRKWRIANPGMANASTAKRFAAKLKAVSIWANHFFIEETYRLAKLRTGYFDFKWHVDHIVPLRSSRVCGLHTEGNLRVIPAIENVKKNNKFWPDMATP